MTDNSDVSGLSDSRTLQATEYGRHGHIYLRTSGLHDFIQEHVKAPDGPKE